MASLRVETNYGPTRREGYKHLRGHNVKAVGKLDYRPVAIKTRERGKVVGILTGYTVWGWLFIDTLWVSEKQRGKGMGKRQHAHIESSPRARQRLLRLQHQRELGEMECSDMNQSSGARIGRGGTSMREGIAPLA